MKRIFWGAVVLCMMLPLIGCAQVARATEGAEVQTTEQETAATEPTQAAEGGNNMNMQTLMKEMRIGLNWGNTFDAPESEIAWGAPMTSQEMIAKVKELGFNTIRIPISWQKHTSGAPDYQIDEAFMNRVDTVVNWALDEGLYVIINSHHDNEEYYPTAENREKANAYLKAIWLQVAEHFKDAPYQLIFQTMNEPRLAGTSHEWYLDMKSEKCVTAVEIINELNQTALDAIRSTGARNADRFVIVSPYCGSPDYALISQYQLPTDSAEGKLIQSIHAYRPYNLALNLNSSESKYNSRIHGGEIRSFMRSVHYKFSKLGVGVVIDEMGCLNKNNPEDRNAWAKDYVSIAREFEMPCIWWDNHAVYGAGELFGLLNRRKLEVYPESQSVYEGLMEGAMAWDEAPAE